jgi:hypothetical protein
MKKTQKKYKELRQPHISKKNECSEGKIHHKAKNGFICCLCKIVVGTNMLLSIIVLKNIACSVQNLSLS